MVLLSKLRIVFLRAVRRENKRRVVYTCLFGYSERFADFEYDRPENTDFVCFTDDPKLSSDFWRVIHVPTSSLDPHRTSKGYKIRPHLYFPNHKYSLYLDNTVKLKKPVLTIFDEFAASRDMMQAFVHPERDCAYEEARVVADIGYDRKSIVEQQMAFYRELGYPQTNGLNVGTLLLRKHNERRVVAAMNAWYEEVLKFSKRDQLSFNFIQWRHGLRVSPILGSPHENEMMEWPTVLNSQRLPRDFEDNRYLELNQDVAAAAVNPREHYLHYGISEGRSYK